MHFNDDPSPAETEPQFPRLPALAFVTLFGMAVFLGVREFAEGLRSGQSFDLIQGAAIAEVGLLPLLGIVLLWRRSRNPRNTNGSASGFVAGILWWQALFWSAPCALPFSDWKRYYWETLDEGGPPVNLTFGAWHITFIVIATALWIAAMWMTGRWWRERRVEAR